VSERVQKGTSEMECHVICSSPAAVKMCCCWCWWRLSLFSYERAAMLGTRHSTCEEQQRAKCSSHGSQQVSFHFWKHEQQQQQQHLQHFNPNNISIVITWLFAWSLSLSLHTIDNFRLEMRCPITTTTQFDMMIYKNRNKPNSYQFIRHVKNSWERMLFFFF
jgi:hypothetical protein